MTPDAPTYTLFDHFHPPLKNRVGWHSFHNTWATFLAGDLNRSMPPGYRALPTVQFNIDVDVAACEEPQSRGTIPPEWRPGGGVWTLPEPSLTLPLPTLTDVVEVKIYDEDVTLVAAVELLSPANKDRRAHRDAFVSKCASLVQGGLGLAVVDVVTERRADLHGALLARLADEDDEPPAFDTGLFAAAYRPLLRDEQTVLDVWHEPLAVGGALPVLPLALKGGPCLPLDLAAAYARACLELRIPPSL